MSTFAEKIEVWIRARDARRFQAEMSRSAASVRELGAASTMSGRKMGALGRGVAVLGKSLKWGGLAIAGMAAEATKLGVDFDSAMERIHTQAGASIKEVVWLRKEVLALSASGKVSQGPNELAAALYRLEGAGIRGAKAMRALRASADLAAVGNADVEDTAKTLAQTLFVGMKGTGNLRQLVGELNATVGAGDLKLQQLVDALGTGVTASAKQAGLSFHDVTGALAVFGDETNNVSGWSAQFATALHFLYAPTEKASNAMEAMGLKSDALAKDFSKPNGLVRALKDLRSHLDRLPGGPHGVKGRQLLSSILPGGRGRVLLVLLNQLDRLQQKIKQVHDTARGTGGEISKIAHPGRMLSVQDVQAQRGGGGFEEAVKRTQQQPLFKLRAAWAQVESAMIHFYDVLKPVVIPALVAAMGVLAKVVVWLTHMGDHVRAVVKFWQGLPQPVKIAAEGIGIFIAQAMLIYGIIRVFMLVKSAILAVRTAIMILRGAIILLQMGSGPLVLALMALVTVAVLIATHWKLTKRLLAAAWKGIKIAFVATWNAIKVAFNAVVAAIVWAAKHGLLGIPGLVISHFKTILNFIKSLPGKIANLAKGMWDGIKTAFKEAINWILSKWNGLQFSIGGWKIHGPGPLPDFTIPKVTVGMPDIPLLASGGTLPIGGLGIVGDAGPELASVSPHGTTITPLSRGKASAGLGGAFHFHFEIPVHVKGREIARATANEVVDWDSRRGK